MFIGIDVHKRYSQIAVMDEKGDIVEEVRVEPFWDHETSEPFRRQGTAPL